MSESRTLLKNAVSGVRKKFDSVAIDVQRYYTDVNGTVIPKNDASIISAGLDVSFPANILGATDFMGGYRVSNQIVPPSNGTYFLKTFIWGTQVFELIQFSGANTIQNFINNGDLVSMYTDDVNSPNFFIFIVTSISDRSYGSFLLSLPELTEKFVSDRVVFTCNNPLNYQEQWTVIRFDKFINPKIDRISTYAYLKPDDYDQDILYIPLDLILVKSVGISTYIQYATDLLTFDFKFSN